ncbi:MAG: conjugal transfer protein TraX [Lachnospiraceae bacterium]|nr:conjugal transfer protein TraX [Lachnospiraceae bacterium]
MFFDHFATAVIKNNLLGKDFDISAWSEGLLNCTELENTLARLYYVFKALGRISFPIFCFCLVIGYLHTRNIKKYILRLAIFAIISEIPFDMAFYGPETSSIIPLFTFEHQNVILTFLISILTILGIDYFGTNLKGLRKQEYTVRSAAVYRLLVLIIGILLSYFLKTDYSYVGLMMLVLIFLTRDFKKFNLVATGILAYASSPFALFSLPFIALYNGKKGRGFKYFFYVFYPLHLFLLSAFRSELGSLLLSILN